MFNKIASVLPQYISSNDTLIIAVSGGPDSLALLNIFVDFSFNIIVAHVNHGIRGKDSNRDEKFVRNLAKSYGFPCRVKRVKLAGKTHIEELGRKIRREFFESLREKYKAKWIVTAHTQDDQLETIIFNFIRGSGPKGLSGMQVANGFYLKPLLSISKKEILAYLKSKKLKFCKDRTNNDTKLSRNFIRKRVLPLLEKLNPSLRKTLLRNSAIFSEIENYLKREAKEFLDKHSEGEKLFNLKDYEFLPSALKTAVIQEAHSRFSNMPYSLPIIKVQEITRMLGRKIGNKRIIYGKKGFLLKKGIVEYI